MVKLFFGLCFVSLTLAGCSTPATPMADGGATFFGFDALAGKDWNSAPDSPVDSASSGSETTQANPDALGDGGPAADVDANVLGVQAEVTATLLVGSKAPLKITVQRQDDSGPPKTTEAVAFAVDGEPVELNAKPGPLGESQAAVALWKSTVTGQYWVAALRPGQAKLTVSVNGVVTEELALETAWADGSGLRMATATAAGSCGGARTKDTEDTIRLEGKTLGKGGLTLTVRFPATAKAGDAFDLDKPAPQEGSLQIVAVMPDLGGQQVKVPTGRLWIDQTDKGWFRGSFAGTSATLQPVVGAFAVERNGSFGVDILDQAVKLATSTTDKWNATGEHDSRAHLSVLDGKALLTWRHISNVTTADLLARRIDSQTGMVEELAPLVTKAVAQVLIDDGSGALVPKPLGEFFGAVSAAQSGDKRLLVWEGKPAAKTASPYQISGQLLDPDMTGPAAPFVIAGDACWGTCRPQVVALPSTHFLVVWTAPAGGVKAAIIDGNAPESPEKLVTVAPSPASGVAASSWEDKVGLVWRHPSQGSYVRLYGSTMSSLGPEVPLGGVVANTFAPAIAAMAEPASFTTLFFAPVGTLQQRRIGLDGTLIGNKDVQLATSVARIAVAAGKPGQVAVVERISSVTANQPQLRLRKVVVGQAGDVGAQLGAEVVLIASVSKYALDPTLCYVPEADTFVVAWSGDASSEGVWVQRFR